MFAVIFEVSPEPARYEDYLAGARMLAPDLQGIDGFVENIRYRSLTREGWILSLSVWRDEKAVVRWRTHARHHQMQQMGRDEMLADYHLRVGELTADSEKATEPVGQRFDETRSGDAKSMTLINASRPKHWQRTDNPYDCAEWLGLNPWAAAVTSWDIYEAMSAEDNLLLTIGWESAQAALAYQASIVPDHPSRHRSVRIVRDYSKYDRREAPQYYPDAPGAKTIHD